MKQMLFGIAVLMAMFFLIACDETKDTNTDNDAIVDDGDTVTDADTARVLTQRRILGEGGFYGISASAGNSEYFAIGAHYAELSATPGENPSGKVYLYKKGTLSTAFSDAEKMLTHPDERPGAGFGYTIGGYCDLNCDGKPDFAVSAHLDSVGSTPNCGTIALFFGGDADPATAVLSLPDGVRKQSDVMGQSLVCFDTDGDGCDDLIAGGQNAGENDTGLIAVWNGAAARPAAEPVLYMEAQVWWQNKQYLGASLAVGDVDGDGKSDLVAGGWGLKKDAESANTGGVYLYKTGDDWSQGPSAVLFPDGTDATGFGSKVILFTVAGTTYIAVMAPDYHTTGGLFVYTFTAGAFALFATLVPADNDPLAADLADIAFSPDFGGKGKGALLAGHKYYGADSTGAVTAFPFPEGTPVVIKADPPVPGDTFGAMVKDIGDINGDGLSDIVVGTPEHIEGDFETGTQPGGIVLLY